MVKAGGQSRVGGAGGEGMTKCLVWTKEYGGLVDGGESGMWKVGGGDLVYFVMDKVE